jgi:hypothetical protein
MGIPEFCLPARLYLILGVLISVVHIVKYKSVFIFCVSLIFTYLWTILMNWLCTNDYTFISWVLFIWSFLAFMVGLYYEMTAPDVAEKKVETHETPPDTKKNI